MFPELTRDDVFRLETARLWLRWPRAADAPAIGRIASSQEVAEMTARIPHPYPPGAAEAFVIDARTRNAGGQAIHLVAALNRGSRAVVGSVSVQAGPGDVAVLGYMVDPAWWGRGVATEAVQSLLDAMFALATIGAVTANVRVINPASRRVLVKCGFAYEGAGLVDQPARGGPLPVEQFRLDRKAWQSLRGWSSGRVVRAPREGVAGHAEGTPPPCA
ncbi:MAG: GNAT family N-acetyltransferase [Alsobacter sp.]